MADADLAATAAELTKLGDMCIHCILSVWIVGELNPLAVQRLA